MFFACHAERARQRAKHSTRINGEKARDTRVEREREMKTCQQKEVAQVYRHLRSLGNQSLQLRGREEGEGEEEKEREEERQQRRRSGARE